jgi:hypothetical protein
VSMLEVTRREEPGQRRLLSLIDGLEAPRDANTLVLPAGAPASDPAHEADPALTAVLEMLAGPSRRFAYGLVLFWSPSHAISVRPPLPPPAQARLEGWDPAPLLDLLGRPRILGVLLLRRGGFSVGVFNDDVLVASKTGARFVKNRHRKGGQSQRRFDRIREKQVDELFNKTCETATQKLGPFHQQLDAVFLGGDRRTVQEFRAGCSYLGTFGARLQERFLSTPEPRQATLSLAYDMIWRSEWRELRPSPNPLALADAEENDETKDGRTER